MRNLFLALILVNLGFAAWHAWFAERPGPTRLQVQAAPQIALVTEGTGEREIGIDAADSTDAGARAAAAEPRDCLSIGPFANRVVVGEAVRALDAAGFAATQRIAQGDVWLGYWVYIDAIPSQAEAAEIVANLTANGIGEAYVIADGSRGSLVSLGVFSVQSRAQQRLDEARRLGYSPVVVDRSQPGDVYWLDVGADDRRAFTAAELLGVLEERPAEAVDCPAR
jgi:SPOR domain